MTVLIQQLSVHYGRFHITGAHSPYKMRCRILISEWRWRIIAEYHGIRFISRLDATELRPATEEEKQELFDALANNRQRMLVAFLYLDKEILPFSEIEKAMQKVLDILRNHE